MTNWLFIGPTLLSGVGQVTKKYAQIVQGEYVEYGQPCSKSRYDIGFAFVLPTILNFSYPCERMIYMTVCETEPVNPVYANLEPLQTLYCPSQFCIEILTKQFPTVTWKLLRHWAPEKPHKAPAPSLPYTFYTIGNIVDPRKNIQGLIRAFKECSFGADARLVLKATCRKPVMINEPGVVVINGLLDEEALDRIHASCHCYVNSSHSEGVGMGAVEAALMSKPVILTDYGGLKEYVKTPWVVPCTKGQIGFDDFLFRKGYTWGYPSRADLVRCMKECFDQKVSFWDHTHTKNLMREVSDQFACGLPNSETPT